MPGTGPLSTGHRGFASTLVLICALAFSPTCSPARLAAEEPATGSPADRSAQNAGRLFGSVQAILKAKCTGCHGDDPQELKGGLDLRSREALLRGGDFGEPVLVPGDAAKSRLYLAVTWRDESLQMPPKEQNRLSAEEVEVLRRWIEAGAPWPAAGKPPKSGWDEASDVGVTVATSGGQSLEWTNRKYAPGDIWAYQPVRPPAVPDAGPGNSPSNNPIDAFIHQQLQAQGLSAAPPADWRTLLRRATFDLTGLPPTAAELEAFLADESPEAFSRVIERLLASPAYGEQMARHWLDVVRYADTSGFSNDFERPNAWRYRDYVIRSFNQDKPFDRFLTEQLAGDELQSDDPEMLVAVGFLRMGPWEQTGMSVAAVTRQQFLDDVTHSVGVTFLAQPLRCASCHDHKFDPVPTRDYYRMQAVFAPVQFADRAAPYLPLENTASFAEGRERTERRLREAKEFLAGLRRKHDAAVARLLEERGVKRLMDLPAGERPQRHYGLSALDMSLEKIYRKRVDYFEREQKRYEAYAFSVYNGPLNNYSSNRAVNLLPPDRQRRGEVQPVYVLAGGSLEAPGEKVAPGVLSALEAWDSPRQSPADSPIPETTEGRRLALAHWIASPQNPLTARVIVNRVWQWHFGRGIVATPNNFGKMGARPSHPALLDWLATWLVEQGWSIKALHRLIMSSATYQQSGLHPDAERIEQLDPENSLLSHFPARRLAAEEIRDALLALSGELSPEMGGPGTYPEIHWEVALQPRHIMGSVAPAYQPSPRPEQRNRRTIYAFRYRTLPDPMLEVFNRPDSETSCQCRDETTVTPQVFALFNGQFAHDRALALAARLQEMRQAGDVAAVIELQQAPGDCTALAELVDRAFRAVYGRVPSDEERAWCVEHLAEMTEHHRQHSPERVELPSVVRREMVEELTGEAFAWEEELDQMEHYQADLKPWDVPPETRALAELCLVLLNCNEFLYLR